MDLEQKAIERIRLASDLSLKHYGKPLVCEYSGGKDSDVLLQLFRMAEIPFEVHNSHTTVDAPQTVRHIKTVFSELADKGIKCEIDYHVQENGKRLTMWNLIPRKLMPPTRIVRYCCPELKEGGNPNRMIATGVRWAESRKRSNRSVIARSVDHYGEEIQSTVCMEECAELIQAISKAKRGKINRDNMIEEIADVLICIEMLKQMYMISDDKINKWIEKKQAREAERMEKNE